MNFFQALYILMGNFVIISTAVLYRVLLRWVACSVYYKLWHLEVISLMKLHTTLWFVFLMNPFKPFTPKPMIQILLTIQEQMYE